MFNFGSWVASVFNTWFVKVNIYLCVISVNLNTCYQINVFSIGYSQEL